MELLARTCKFERMNVERLVARLVVAAGGLFWFVAAIGAISYLEEEGEVLLNQAWVLLGVTVVVLLIGWFYEVLAALVLFGLTIAFVVFAFVAPGINELGVWALWLLFTAAPAVLSGVLFLSAARMQKICEYDATADAA